MPIEFYDVKTRQKVSVDEERLIKVTFETKSGVTRYGLRGKTPDGRLLTKFVSKKNWDSLVLPKKG